MSGGRSGSTPTPPQLSDSPTVQANGESVTSAAALVRPDDRGRPTPPPPSKTPELAKSELLLTESASSDTNTTPSEPPQDLPLETLPLPTPAPTAPVIADVMDAPRPTRDPTPSPKSAPEVPAYPAPLPAAIRSAAKIKKDAVVVVKQQKEEVEDVPRCSLSTTNGVAEVEPEKPSVVVPPAHLEAPLESPIAQPEELRLPNGLPLPAPRDPEVPETITARTTTERDDSPIAEPDISDVVETPVTQAPILQTPLSSPPVVEKPTPVEETPVELVVEEEEEEEEVMSVEPEEEKAPVETEEQEECLAPTQVAVIEESPVPDPAETVPVVAESVEEMELTPPPLIAEEVLTPPPPTAEEALTPPPPTAEEVSTPPPPAEEESTPPPPTEEALTPPPSTAEEELTPPPSTAEEELTPPPATAEEELTPPPATEEDREETETPPPPQTLPPALVEATMQAAVSVPKKKRKMKDLNKKETVGDLLDAFKEQEQVVVPPEPEPTPVPETKPPVVSTPAPEDPDMTWEDKEDKEGKMDAENTKPDPNNPDKKYQYKEENWKPIDPEQKKHYDRKFLLGFQFMSASMNKPEGLPAISDVVLDQANKAPLRQLDPSRMKEMISGPDFTPSFANLGRPNMGGGGGGGGREGRDGRDGREGGGGGGGGGGGREERRGPPPGMGMGMGVGGPRRSAQMQREKPRKVFTTMSLSDDIQLNKAEKAWKPSTKKTRVEVESESDDSEHGKTQELFKSVRSILNKLTPQKFQQLMKMVTDLTIDTEERLKGVIDLTFEKAIAEPNFSVAYANMCRCLMGLKVETTDKPGVTVNFRKLLLNRCQKEFEKDQVDDEIFERKQKELDAATVPEEKQRLTEQLQREKDNARRRSMGNMKFIGELFKLKMLTEVIMHDCIVKLLKNHDEESLECLCRLLSTIGKDLDFEKAKPRMDQYFNQMEKIIKDKKTSSRIRFMLQDVLDLRRSSWVPRRGEQGPKTIEQIHKDAELEEQREQMKVQHAFISKPSGGHGGRNDGGRNDGGRNDGGGRGGRGGREGREGRDNQGRGQAPQDEGWNTVPISTKNRPIDTSRLSKITKTPAVDFNIQVLGPGGKGMFGSWGKGSSGGSTTAKPAEAGPEQPAGRPATNTGNRFSALQQATAGSSAAQDSDRRVPQRNSSSRERGDRFDRSGRGNDRFDRRDDRDRNRLQVTKRSFSRENEGSREREQRGSADPVRRVASMTDDRGSRERARSKEDVTREKTDTPPPPPASTKPTLTEEELTKKSTAIIEEYLHLNDMKEALQCVHEMSSTQLLFLFVQTGLESTLERSTIARERMGLLLQQLIKTGTLPKQQYYNGLQEILEVAEDMAIDIPHIWLYLAELISPMLHEGGIPMGELFREISKPLIPLGQAGVLLVQILNLLCKEISHKKAGAMWREGGLRWGDFLPEDVDVNKFVTEKKVEFTLGVESEDGQKEELSSEELSKQIQRLIQDQADDQRLFDWIEANLDEQQMSSNMLVRALMTCICQSAIIYENPNKVDAAKIKKRAKVLQKYLSDDKKELQALYALQALMVELEQPANLLRMFFDSLYDEDVIKEEAFYKWESSKDPAEQQGKGVALKSVTAFFTWLREAEDEDESDNS
ncbi:hypothetical protein KUCAC02_021985 [Chaenocephalus aceratus]|nr:hypothetical protein KUCAC02_021985 [Chaenocephalus aceratus]